MKWTSQSQNRGMSLVEMLVVVAILGFISLMIASTFSDIFKWQTQVMSRDASNEFAASVARFLFTDSTCTSALTGQKFPENGRAEVSLPGYMGYGAGSATAGGTLTTLAKGAQIGTRLRIRDLYMENAGMAPQSVLAQGSTLKRYMARVTLSLEEQSQGQWRSSPPRTMEFPILVNPGNHQIQRCYLEMMVDDACQVLGSTFDPSTGKCVPMTQCLFEGSYNVHSCVPNVRSCPPNETNQMTGTTSCPSGISSRRQTGEYNYRYKESCGKKCSRTVRVNVKYYVCLKCNK